MSANRKKLLRWLRKQCAEFSVGPYAILKADGAHKWPLVAKNEEELRRALLEADRLLPLPAEPAALANVIEVSVLDFLEERFKEDGISKFRRGKERQYPDLEISDDAFGGGIFAIDVKVARRAKNLKKTQSRITLYTGNTYFRIPEIDWPGILRPFDDYESHLDIIVLYTLSSGISRIQDIELIVHEAWQVASKERSSTTREYIGAVMEIDALRAGKGEFKTEGDFYRFWRSYTGFRVGRAVEQKFQRALRKKGKSTHPLKPSFDGEE